MSDVKRDNNQIPTLGAISNLDGVTPAVIKADPSTHAMAVDDGTTGSDLSGDDAKRDNNGYPGALAISETDGVTTVPLYAILSNGKLLIDSN